jgi:hypothetical protein
VWSWRAAPIASTQRISHQGRWSQQRCRYRHSHVASVLPLYWSRVVLCVAGPRSRGESKGPFGRVSLVAILREK